MSDFCCLFLARKIYSVGMGTITVSSLLIPNPETLGTLAGDCAICGRWSDTACHRDDILDKTSANLTAIFELNDRLVCASCAEVWRKPKYWHRGICARPGIVVFPVISTESVTEDRPTWSAILRELPNDPRPRALILTTDPKKRVWPMAKVSQGPVASIYVHDTSRGVSGNYVVQLRDLVDCLELVEKAYSLGFSKSVIQRSLFDSMAAVRLIGFEQAIQMEQGIAAHREAPHFIPALIASQKQEEMLETHDTIPIRRTSDDLSSPRGRQFGFEWAE